MKKMMRCQKCGSYTLLEEHCGYKTVSAHPPLFNPHDKYGEYRRKAKGLG
ncbi:MAG: nucleolar RNA-binding Nop10p family protein [Candidatus Bilamarchaeaceae archaeon]